MKFKAMHNFSDLSKYYIVHTPNHPFASPCIHEEERRNYIGLLLTTCAEVDIQRPLVQGGQKGESDGVSKADGGRISSLKGGGGNRPDMSS